MTYLMIIAAAGLTLGLPVPASADVYEIMIADRRGSLVVDCPHSPEGRALRWVATNCQLTAPPTVAAGKVTVRGWNPDGKQVLVEFAEGDLDRPVIIGRVWNSNDKPPQ